MSHPEVSGLYAITPDVIDTVNLVMLTQQALIGGAKLIQYRNKTADSILQLEQAASLLHLCRVPAGPTRKNSRIRNLSRLGQGC